MSLRKQRTEKRAGSAVFEWTKRKGSSVHLGSCAQRGARTLHPRYKLRLDGWVEYSQMVEAEKAMLSQASSSWLSEILWRNADLRHCSWQSSIKAVKSALSADVLASETLWRGFTCKFEEKLSMSYCLCLCLNMGQEYLCISHCYFTWCTTPPQG